MGTTGSSVTPAGRRLDSAAMSGTQAERSAATSIATSNRGLPHLPRCSKRSGTPDVLRLREPIGP
jgi:hypothetical protein